MGFMRIPTSLSSSSTTTVLLRSVLALKENKTDVKAKTKAAIRWPLMVQLKTCRDDESGYRGSLKFEILNGQNKWQQSKLIGVEWPITCKGKSKGGNGEKQKNKKEDKVLFGELDWDSEEEPKPALAVVERIRYIKEFTSCLKHINNCIGVKTQVL